MRNKKTARQKRRWRNTRGKNRKYAVVGSVCAIAVLGFATLAGPLSNSLGSRKIRSLFFSAPPPPPLPSPGSPSKEYIYAGGRLIATEEPNPLTAPTNLVANTISNVQVDISWSASAGAHHYQVERAPNLGGSYTVLNSNVTGTTFTDSTVTSVNAYLYRVKAADAVGNLSPPGNIDVATAINFTDNPITAGVTPIKAQHVSELRQAIGAIRATANLSAPTWTDGTLTNVIVKAVHVTEMRTNLDQALTAIGISVTSYTDTSLSGVTIKKVHMDELRLRVK